MAKPNVALSSYYIMDKSLTKVGPTYLLRLIKATHFRDQFKVLDLQNCILDLNTSAVALV